MKKYLLLALMAASFTLRAALPFSGGDSDFEQTEDATHIPAMIMVTDSDIDETIAFLESRGVIVLRHRANILLTYIPVDADLSSDETPDGESAGEGQRLNHPRRAQKIPGIDKIEYSRPRKISPMMNQARFFNNANLIADGLDLPSPYDGTGIVVGVCDIGMDTRHPNFLNDDMTESRIRRVVYYEEQQGRRTVYSTPEEIYEWRTDNPDDWHATHVTGIAAGSSPLRTETGNSYRSLAPRADIVFTASQLSDVGLLAGVEDIIDYAREVNKPAVINLSMGNYTGPHDGTSLFTRYLDLCAEDAVICLSAGNEGATGETKAMSFDFTEGQTVLRVLPNDWDGIEITGVAEVWSPDATAFDFTFYWHNDTGTAGMIDIYPPMKGAPDETVEWSLSLDPEAFDYDSTFASLYREGYVKASSGISPLNGRYCATVEFVLKTDIYHADSRWAEYWPGIKIEGEPGTHIDIYAGSGSFLRQERGFPAPDNAMNVSDLATGFKTVSVGMTNNTDIQDGAEPGSGYAKGDICAHSSSGTLLDGRKLPLTCAPGAYVTSSISSAFLEAHPDQLQYIDDSSAFGDGNVYWIGTIGTSMSCPFVVSAIATWLQAYPQLTSEDVISIIKKTNQTQGYPAPDDPRHGQGWFNPYKGIQEVVRLAALNVGTVESTGVTIKVERGRIIIGNPTGKNLGLEVYNASGQTVDRKTITRELDSYDLSCLDKGIYIVKVADRTLKLAI